MNEMISDDAVNLFYTKKVDLHTLMETKKEKDKNDLQWLLNQTVKRGDPIKER